MKQIFFKKVQVTMLSTAFSVLVSFFFFSFLLSEWVFSKSFPFLFLGYSTAQLLVAFFIALPVSILTEWIVRKVSNYREPLTFGIYVMVHLIVCAWLLFSSNHPVISIIFILLVTGTYVGNDAWFTVLRSAAPTKTLLRKWTSVVTIVFFVIWFISFFMYQSNPNYPDIILSKS